MNNTLIIAGQTYTNVAGIKAVDSSDTTQIYVQPSGSKQISISSNGTVSEDVAAYASAQINVAVPNTYVAGDEGKVVSSGALISQSSASYSVNGLYDTTLISSINIEVPGLEPTGTINIINNGMYNVGTYASASVLVPNTYSVSDEGKVVSSGELVAQGSATYSSNGTYDTTLVNSVDINVSGGGGQTVYTSSTGLLYTPVMTINMSMERTNGYTVSNIMDRYGSMPYLEELILTGIARRMTSANLCSTAATFTNEKYPLLKKLHLCPTEMRSGTGAVIDTSDANYNAFTFGHYIFSNTNLTELVIGKIGGPYFNGGGYFRSKDENGNSIYTVGSTAGLTLKVYVAEYKNQGGFNNGTVATNTTIIEYDYQTGEILTP